MSKSYFMVQYALPYVDPTSNTFKSLSDLILSEADKFIKARKMTKYGVWPREYSHLPADDYRMAPRCSKMDNEIDANGNIIYKYFDPGKDMVFYRILMDQQSANEWMDIVTNLGFHTVRIITEADRGVLEGVPANLSDFPTDETVAQFLWSE